MQTRHNHPVKQSLTPLHRRGIAKCGYARQHPVRLRRRVRTRCNCPSVSVLDTSPPQEGNCQVQTRHNHPVKQSLTPLHRRGIAKCGYARQHPVRLRRRVRTRCNCPSVSVLDISPPQEGNCQVQTRHNHPVKQSLTPLHRRGIAKCRHATTTPSGFAAGCRRDAIAPVYLY